MNDFEAFIIKQIIKENYYITLHARSRMIERSITDGDIICAAENLISISHQFSKGTYVLHGYSTWNEILTLIVAIKKTALIVTVYLEEAE